MPKYIKHCIASGGTDAEILKQHVDSELDPLYIEYGGYHTGVDLKTDKVFSLCPGTVLFVGKDDSQFSIIVQLTGNTCVMYKNVEGVIVSVGDEVKEGQFLCDATKFLHVDLLQRNVTKWPVRVRGITYYKTNPMKLLTDGYSEFIKDNVWSYDPLSLVGDTNYVDNRGE